MEMLLAKERSGSLKSSKYSGGFEDYRSCRAYGTSGVHGYRDLDFLDVRW